MEGDPSKYESDSCFVQKFYEEEVPKLSMASSFSSGYVSFIDLVPASRTSGSTEQDRGSSLINRTRKMEHAPRGVPVKLYFELLETLSHLYTWRTLPSPAGINKDVLFIIISNNSYPASAGGIYSYYYFFY